MDIGTSITASTGILGAVAVVFRIFWREGKPNGHCEDHSGFCTSIKGMSEWLTKVEKKLDRVIEQRTSARE